MKKTVVSSLGSYNKKKRVATNWSIMFSEWGCIKWRRAVFWGIFHMLLSGNLLGNAIGAMLVHDCPILIIFLGA